MGRKVLAKMRLRLDGRTRVVLLTLGLVAMFALAACVSIKTTVPGPGKLVGSGNRPIEPHPAFRDGQPCSSCKADLHDWQHQPPFSDIGDCTKCHNVDSWKVTHYKHTDDRFNISFHGIIGCVRCHKEGRVALPSTKCETCHKAPHPGSKDCALCHTPLVWQVQIAPSGRHVSLQGGHSKLNCFSCHASSDSFRRVKQCSDCHGTKHGGLRNCAMCHDPRRGWKPKPGWSHGAFFAITGRHTKLQCTDCHTQGRFSGTPTYCSGCHGTKHGGLANCGACHSTYGFTPARFAHSSVFPLRGAHDRLSCTKCHPGLRFVTNIGGGSTRCVSCHGRKHGGLANCAKCHTTYSFRPSTFRHASVFPLRGAHARLRCGKCHPNGDFVRPKGGGSHACVACHGTKHGGERYCATCHTTRSWRPSTFEHSSVFVLTGAHRSLACTKCHPYGNFLKPRGGGSHACVSCHGTKHGGLTNCASCHITTAWIPIKFIEHPGYITLGDAHRARSCTLCHPTLVFTGATRPCSDCHTAPHVQPTDCLRCHRPTVWSELHFTHDPRWEPGHTGLPDPDCLSCHDTGNYGVYQCTSCHDPIPPSP